MTNYTIRRNWYEEIKNIVPMENPYFYTDKVFGEQVEVDVLDEDLFCKVSKELGWML